MTRSRLAGRLPLWHHVVNRAGSVDGPVRPPFSHRRALDQLAGLEECFGVEVHAFCVMGTHDHLLVRAPASLLEPAMVHIAELRGVAPRLLPIRAERHAFQTTRYIHRNPVVAGLVARAEDWPWSSYRGYLNPVEGPPWLHTATMLARFGAIGVHARYRAFVEAVPGRGGGIVDGRTKILPLPGAARVFETNPAPLATIAREVAAAFGCSVDSLRVRPGRSGDAAIVARGAFLYAARSLEAWPPAAIAAWVGYASPRGAARAVARFAAAADADPRLLRRLERVFAALVT